MVPLKQWAIALIKTSRPDLEYVLCLLFQIVEYQLPYYFVISMKHMHLCLVAFGSDLKKNSATLYMAVKQHVSKHF